MNPYRQSDAIKGGVVGGEFDFLNEDRGGLYQPPFGPQQASLTGIHIDFAFEQAGGIGPRLHFEDVYVGAVDLGVAAVDELVMRRGDRRARRVIFLRVLNILLQQPHDDIALYKAIAGKMYRFEMQLM